MLHSYDELTHHGVSSDDGGCVAGDSIAARARVDTIRVRPTHLAAVQRVVLGGQGQRLPLLGGTNSNMQFKYIELNLNKQKTITHFRLTMITWTQALTK